MTESFNITFWLMGSVCLTTGIAVSLFARKLLLYDPFSRVAAVSSVLSTSTGIAAFAALGGAGSPEGSVLATTMHKAFFLGPVIAAVIWLVVIYRLRGVAWEDYQRNGRVYPGGSVVEIEAWARRHGKL